MGLFKVKKNEFWLTKRLKKKPHWTGKGWQKILIASLLVTVLLYWFDHNMLF